MCHFEHTFSRCPICILLWKNEDLQFSNEGSFYLFVLTHLLHTCTVFPRPPVETFFDLLFDGSLDACMIFCRWNPNPYSNKRAPTSHWTFPSNFHLNGGGPAQDSPNDDLCMYSCCNPHVHTIKQSSRKVGNQWLRILTHLKHQIKRTQKCMFWCLIWVVTPPRMHTKNLLQQYFSIVTPHMFFFFALGVHNIATVYKWVVGKWLSTPRDRFRLWPEVRARSGQHAKYPRVPWSKNCMSNGWAKTRLLTMCDHLFCWFLGVILSHDWCNQLFFGEQEKISGEFTTCCKH